MRKDENTRQGPPSGMTVLPDGRVQVVFKHIDVEKLIELPKHVYTVVQEFSLKDGPVTEEGMRGLFFVLDVATELVPDHANNFIRSLQKIRE